MKKLILSSLIFLFSFFLVLSPALAQDNRTGSGINAQRGNNDGSSGITNPAIGELGDSPTDAAAGSIFQKYFITLWQALISVGALMVLIYFLWAGIEWISAGGDSGKVQKARDKITQAVVGMIVLVGAFAIITWISRIFFGSDFNILQLQFGDQTQQVPNNSGASRNTTGGNSR